MSCSRSTITCAGGAVVILFFAVGLPLIFILTDHGGPKSPTFAVESTVVKAFNLTSDNRLFCIINLGIRAHNPNPKKHSLYVYARDMEVKKGKRHKLADDRVMGFHVGPGEDVAVHVEVVGLHVRLGRRIAEEVRGDVAAGEGRVNFELTGSVGSDELAVTCGNVGVDFSRVNVGVKGMVKCGVSVTNPYDSNSG